jgi:hypothetical protein
MMKKTIICLLVLAALGLVGACFMSIYADIEFDKDKSEREQVVIARLMQIRDAEEEFRKGHYGEFCGTLDSLIDFVKEGKAVVKIDEDVWTDELAESFESKRAAIEAGKFRSDTIWQSAAEKLGISNPDSLKLVPIGRAGAEFQLRKHEAFNLKSNEFDKVCEIRANLDDYMDGLSEKKIRLLKQDLKKRGKNRADLFEDNADDFEGEWYGLRVGDLKDPQNKMSGNWE